MKSNKIVFSGITLLFFLIKILAVEAHIGSPDIFYDGQAGPYKLEVFIQPPEVVPGIAKILVNLKEDGAARVQLQPVYFQYGSTGAPDADVANRIPGSEKSFEGQLWLMAFGSASVRVTVEGAKGLGNTIVPVPAIATATRKMDATTSTVLIPLGLLLFAGFVTIIGVSTSQATVDQNKTLDPASIKRSYWWMVIVGILLAIGIFFAKKWWDSVEAHYRAFMFKPLTMETEIKAQDESSRILIHLKNQPWLERRLTDIVPDHGKMMHLFLIQEDGSFFTHLHPSQTDSSEYWNQLPSLPQGRFKIFADVVHENGMAETITDTLNLPERIAGKLSGLSEEGYWEEKDTANTELLIKESLKPPFKSKSLSRLAFQVTDKKGNLVQVEPYLGMKGHAVVMKEDGSVFIHLHPMGTVSMASQVALASKVKGEVTLCNPLVDSTNGKLDTLGLVDNTKISVMNEVKNAQQNPWITFPYAFPSPGKYWVWVQVKQGGKIHTGRFTFNVL